MARVSAPRGSRPLLHSVVKVLTVSDAPDYEQPWQTHGAINASGSGAIIETSRGLRVLTNGHVVQNHVFVELRRFGSAQRYVAQVEAAMHECDLALLRVRDETFFEGAEPVRIGELPELGDRVAVCGYPVGGDRLSLTEGVVSRIEVTAYAHSQRPLLAVQIDAAINAGNSGGPVFQGDRLVGVAFQALEESQNIAYAIASPIVEHFLRDVGKGHGRGFPSLGVGWQRLEAEAHRRSLGLSPDEGGILVTRVAWESSAWGVLEPGDVILAIGGVRVFSDGTSVLRPGELVDHSHFVTLRHVGDRLPIHISRAGERRTVEALLGPPRPQVPEDRYDVRPTYFVYGGLLFVPLTRDYLKSWGSDWWKQAPNELMAIYETSFRRSERQDVVVLQKVLADRVNRGYHELENWVVAEVDGVPVRSMRHLVACFEAAHGRFVQVTLNDGQRLVLDRAQAEKRLPAILARYGVPADRSADLRASRKRSAKA